MLEYSGTLLHGLRIMGADDVIDSLKRITCATDCRRAVEWLGSPWGHAVAPSTPVQDFRLHVRAWQHHFAAIFGLDALARVRGFSPSEMALPNHPEVAYEFVRTLVECGYRWVLVQEHTVEEPDTGAPPRRPHLPHRLVCRNAAGKTVSIVAIVKTQGSDTKLVAQMQPWYEAKGLQRSELAGRSVPPLVTQIADGENGGVMMNEFPSKYFDVVREASGSDVPLMNATEYLEHLFARGIRESDLPEIQPMFHGRIWTRMRPGDGVERLERVIEELRREDDRFHMEGGSWTSSLTWVKGYENVLGPMEEASALFHDKDRQPATPDRRAPLSQRPAAPAGVADELLPVLGPGSVDRLRPRDLPPRPRRIDLRLLKRRPPARRTDCQSVGPAHQAKTHEVEQRGHGEQRQRHQDLGLGVSSARSRTSPPGRTTGSRTRRSAISRRRLGSTSGSPTPEARPC